MGKRSRTEAGSVAPVSWSSTKFYLLVGRQAVELGIQGTPMSMTDGQYILVVDTSIDDELRGFYRLELMKAILCRVDKKKVYEGHLSELMLNDGKLYGKTSKGRLIELMTYQNLRAGLALEKIGGVIPEASAPTWFYQYYLAARCEALYLSLVFSPLAITASRPAVVQVPIPLVPVFLTGMPFSRDAVASSGVGATTAQLPTR